MKRILLLVTILIVAGNLSFSQDRIIARGAGAGELYHTHLWYGIYDPIWGPPYYDTLRSAIYHLTENGKKLTIQYDVDYFANEHNPPESVMIPTYILADATPGVVYNKCSNYKDDGYTYTHLWVSLDYGKNWIFRDESIDRTGYYAVNLEGIIYRYGLEGYYKSTDYGQNFYLTDEIVSSEPGVQNGEAFSAGSNAPYQGRLLHTYNFYETYTLIPIDSQFMFGQMGGVFPDVYRGSKEGEVYVSSLFPEPEYKRSYKISFSADTGHTFRHVYVNEDFYSDPVAFMLDREPGVFYIIHALYVEDANPLGWHKRICVEYYRDYGETLEAVFCHDLTKNYGSTCEAVTDLALEKCSNNCILLSWSEPESSLPVEKYQVYRNNVQITNCELRENTYLDENLSAGEYEYYVVTHYTTGCVSDSSNHVVEMIELGVQEIDSEITIYPNPTTGELIMENGELTIENIEIFDIYGKKTSSHHLIISSANHKIDIPHLQAGIYFVKIQTEKGITTKKIIKY